MVKKYFVNILLVIGLYITVKVGFEIEAWLKKDLLHYFDPTKMRIYLYVFPLLIGVYLSLFTVLELLINRKKDKVNLAFNWTQFFTITVPVAIISLLPYMGVGRMMNPLFYFIFCIVLGYSFMTCIKKKSQP